MTLSRIITSAALALALSAFSLLSPLFASADASDDLNIARLRVAEYRDAARDLRALTPADAAKNPERIAEARRIADEAQDALIKTRWAIAEEFRRGQYGIQNAILLTQYLMREEASMREANRWMSDMPLPPVDGAGMTAKEAIRLLNADAQVLEEYASRAEQTYGYYHAGATLQAAFDKLGAKAGTAGSWGGFLWMDLLDTMNRLNGARDMVRNQARELARHPERLNAGYVRYLHSSMTKLNADAGRFFDLANRIVDNMAHQALALDHGREKGLFGAENPELKQHEVAMKGLWKEFKEVNLVVVPASRSSWTPAR
ncbi:MAG: hypothetical protein AAB074_03190 [Planctomycetota bacterium]